MSDVYYYYYDAFISRHVIIPIYKGRHTGVWKLPWDKADVTYYEDLGKEH